MSDKPYLTVDDVVPLRQTIEAALSGGGTRATTESTILYKGHQLQIRYAQYVLEYLDPTGPEAKKLDPYMSIIEVNGSTYSGRDIQIIGGGVLIDGKPLPMPMGTRIINIKVTGDVQMIQADKIEYLEVTGDVGVVQTIKT